MVISILLGAEVPGQGQSLVARPRRSDRLSLEEELGGPAYVVWAMRGSQLLSVLLARSLDRVLVVGEVWGAVFHPMLGLTTFKASSRWHSAPQHLKEIRGTTRS